MQYKKIYIRNTIFIHTWYIFSNPKFWNEIPQICKNKKICDMHIHLEPTHEHLTTTQFLVASPAFCRYSIYFLHCAPPIPITIISTNTNTTKNKTKDFLPTPIFWRIWQNIHQTIDPTRARAISSEQQKNPAHSHGILILHIETSSMAPPNVVGYCVLHPSGWPKPGALKSRPTHHVSPTFHATPTAP